MDMKAVKAFIEANELANDIYEIQSKGYGQDIHNNVWEEYAIAVQAFEDMSGESFGEKREEFLNA